MRWDTARGTALTGIQHEVHLTTVSAYVELDEVQRTVDTSDEDVSAEHSQGTSEAAPHDITTIVNYMGETNTETEGGKDALSALYVALAKIFGRKPEDE